MEKRTRTGCQTCRSRRIKCDEAKPTCKRCRTANFQCLGYKPARKVVVSPKSTSSREISPRESPPQEENPSNDLSWRHANWRKEQLPLYHHFVTTTVDRLFRSDHASFWRDQAAQMSGSLDLVYEVILAVGAVHRASLLACQFDNVQEAGRFRVMGLDAYGNTLRLLPAYLAKDEPKDVFPVLIALMLLAYFECFMENPKAAFRHLWAAIQLLRRSEGRLSEDEVLNMVPIYDVMIRLDFLAQKLVPYARSSFLRCSDLAIMETPFWNRRSLEFSGNSKPDQIATERYRLIRIICAHNKLSRVVWGCWCPVDERPSRDELIGFHSEMKLWRASSPATFASSDGLDILELLDTMPLDSLPVPPPACYFDSKETAMNMLMYNAYLGCAMAMISTTDPDPAARELEANRLVYQNLCIVAGILEKHKNGSGGLYKPCDSISTGISIFLYHGTRRCYSQAWQTWTITALRAIGREGLSNGFTSANTLQIMLELESKLALSNPLLWDSNEFSWLGPIRDRIFPILMPRGDDGLALAYYLRYAEGDFDGDGERNIQVMAKATWRQDVLGNMKELDLMVYDAAISADFDMDGPDALELFASWREAVEKGWHGYLESPLPK